MLANANGNQHVYTYYGYATKVETNQKQADGTYSRIQSWSQSIGSLNRVEMATRCFVWGYPKKSVPIISVFWPT
jgi:hypothetical protein